jgi:hypothetical protein
MIRQEPVIFDNQNMTHNGFQIVQHVNASGSVSGSHV